MRDVPALTDAQRAKITRLGIGVDTRYPREAFAVVSIVDESVMPTEAELKLIRAYVEFTLPLIYNEQAQRKALAGPIIGVPGHNTVSLFKDDTGWRYSRWTWNTPMYPRFNMPGVKLAALLDHIVGNFQIEEWKAARKASAKR